LKTNRVQIVQGPDIGFPLNWFSPDTGTLILDMHMKRFSMDNGILFPRWRRRIFFRTNDLIMNRYGKALSGQTVLYMAMKIEKKKETMAV
jgi:hypothetical protein